MRKKGHIVENMMKVTQRKSLLIEKRKVNRNKQYSSKGLLREKGK